MARDWESTFRSWASPPGKTEQERCENAKRAINNAIARSPQLSQRNIKVFTQGSYQNNTNVRQDSDVDIGILCYDTFFMQLPEGYTREHFSINPPTYYYSQFKNEVGQALVDYFGYSSLNRGNKAFDIRGTSYHVDTDVAPFFEHRRYFTDGSFLGGVELQPDDDQFKRVINWPEQHYNNGVSKNNKTGRRYKAMVRILKKLCNEMTDNGIPAAQPIPGFLDECLVWNVPDNHFGNNSYVNDVRKCLVCLYNNTDSDEKCSGCLEVSDLKYLFHISQKWTRSQVNSFIVAVWNYVGFQ